MPNSNPLLLPVVDVCARLSIGRTAFYQLRQSGRFGPTVHALGGKLLVRADELEAWVQADMPSQREWQALKAAGTMNQSQGLRLQFTG